MKRHLVWLAVVVSGASLLFEIVLRLTPLPETVTQSPPASREFVDRHGRTLRTILVDERRYARHIELTDVSPALIAATLCAEDKRFWHHPGVDPFALANAFRRSRFSGASTITQQLIKLSLPGERTLRGKLAEACLALRLERTWRKDEILAAYLNRLDYGNLQIGIASASRFYFGKAPSDLSTAEAALLAALPNAPSKLNPHRHLDAALVRQRWVLRRLQATGRIDQSERERAEVESLRLVTPRHEFAAPHFVDLLLHREGAISRKEEIIRTSLDLELNRRAEEMLRHHLAQIRDKNATSGAVVIIENQTGEVLALAGSGDYFRAGEGQVNGAWQPRSPGSAVKPFTFLLALEQGANPCTVVADVPTEFATLTGTYAPNNYNHRFYGPVSLRFALGNSLNVATIRALEMGGGPAALHFALKRAGITTLGHSAEYYGLGLTLGNAEVRLLELANAYACIAREGVHRPFRLLLDGESPVQSARIFQPDACYLVADMLADNGARAASFGLESFLAFDFPVACKTGTSSDYRDNWAVGFTPEFTVAVWVGNPDGSPMRNITGVTGAGPILHDLFQHLHNTRGTTWFKEPANVGTFSVHPLTGRRVVETRTGAVREKCLHEPKMESPSDYDANGRVILPTDYGAWLQSSQNMLGNLVTVQNKAPVLKITHPSAGTIYFLDSDLPVDSQRITVRAEGVGALEWSSPLAFERTGENQIRATLGEGVHVIEVGDSTGAVTSTWIDVRSL